MQQEFTRVYSKQRANSNRKWKQNGEQYIGGGPCCTQVINWVEAKWKHRVWVPQLFSLKMIMVIALSSCIWFPADTSRHRVHENDYFWHFLQPLTCFMCVLGVCEWEWAHATPPCCAPSALAAITRRASAHSYLLITPEPEPNLGQSTGCRLLPETALWRLGWKIDKEVGGDGERWAWVRARRLQRLEIGLPVDDPPENGGEGGEKDRGISEGEDGGKIV